MFECAWFVFCVGMCLCVCLLTCFDACRSVLVCVGVFSIRMCVFSCVCCLIVLCMCCLLSLTCLVDYLFLLCMCAFLRLFVCHLMCV